MSFTQTLLYLLLLYAVLDDKNKLSISTGILIALGIILFGFCCNPQLRCDNDNRRRFENSFNMANGL